MNRISLYSPRPAQFAATAGPSVDAVTLPSLEGRTVGIVDNGKFLALAVAIEAELVKRGVGEVLWFRAAKYTEFAPVEWFDDIAAKVAGAITGIGN